MFISRAVLLLKFGPKGLLTLERLWKYREQDAPTRFLGSNQSLTEGALPLSLTSVIIATRKFKAVGLVCRIGKLREGKFLKFRVVAGGIEVSTDVAENLMKAKNYCEGRGKGGGAPKGNKNRLGRTFLKVA